MALKLDELSRVKIIIKSLYIGLYYKVRSWDHYGMLTLLPQGTIFRPIGGFRTATVRLKVWWWCCYRNGWCPCAPRYIFRLPWCAPRWEFEAVMWYDVTIPYQWWNLHPSTCDQWNVAEFGIICRCTSIYQIEPVAFIYMLWNLNSDFETYIA